MLREDQLDGGGVAHGGAEAFRVLLEILLCIPQGPVVNSSAYSKVLGSLEGMFQ